MLLLLTVNNKWVTPEMCGHSAVGFLDCLLDWYCYKVPSDENHAFVCTLTAEDFHLVSAIHQGQSPQKEKNYIYLFLTVTCLVYGTLTTKEAIHGGEEKRSFSCYSKITPINNSCWQQFILMLTGLGNDSLLRCDTNLDLLTANTHMLHIQRLCKQQVENAKRHICDKSSYVVPRQWFSDVSYNLSFPVLSKPSYTATLCQTTPINKDHLMCRLWLPGLAMSN